ncbi:MAG: A/G-specific adenine glycosylase, partial [Chloroflexi bacterium]|nr:A/G-specific adenine glycosylase [Chloroflexota bacterium]
MQIPRFRRIIWAYYRRHGRAMPWRHTRDPYRIVVSEIMLQQTQVARVLKFYPVFIKKFPNFRALARARTPAVLAAWQGMGYNRRALALQKLSRIVLEKFNGRLPHGREELESLPGIGVATSGSIRAFAWDEPEVFIETNIRRVFIHFFFPRRMKVTDQELMRYIRRALPRTNVREWYWALMDYGAMLGSGAGIAQAAFGGRANPNRRSARYRVQPRFAGSDRELRGML